MLRSSRPLLAQRKFYDELISVVTRPHPTENPTELIPEQQKIFNEILNTLNGKKIESLMLEAAKQRSTSFTFWRQPGAIRVDPNLPGFRNHNYNLLISMVRDAVAKRFNDDRFKVKYEDARWRGYINSDPKFFLCWRNDSVEEYESQRYAEYWKEVKAEARKECQREKFSKVGST